MFRDKQIIHLLNILRKEKNTILKVYIDEIIVIGNDSKEMEEIKLMMYKEYEVKELGTLKYFLGMKIARCKKGISVFQRKYILDLLKEIGILGVLGCKPSNALIDLGN